MTTFSPPTEADQDPVPSGRPGARRGPRVSRRAWRAAAVVAVFVIGLGLPVVVSNPYYLGIATDGAVLGILALSIGFLASRCGLISLGHTTFFGLAAYTFAISTTNWGWAPLVAALFAVLVGSAVGALVGAAIVRTPGIGFLVLTLAIGQAFYQLSVQTALRPLTGTYDGIPIIYADGQTMLGRDQADMGDASQFWPIAWTVLIGFVVVVTLVTRSRFGRTIEAVRENEERARFSGLNTFTPRLLAFMLSATGASVAGVLFALKANYVSPNVFSFVTAGDSVIAALVGGWTTAVGPVIGAVLYVFGQSELGATGNLQLFTGIALVVTIAFLRTGIVGALTSLWSLARRVLLTRRTR